MHHVYENGLQHAYYFRDSQAGTEHICHCTDKTRKHTEYVNHIQKKTLGRPSISSEKDEECVRVTSSGK